MGPSRFPKLIRWANFSEAWETGVKNYFWNSVIVTGFKVPIGIILESMAAFALTHMHFKWADRVFTYILIGLIVPMQMTLVPLTLLMNALNLIDTLTGLTILYIGFGVPFGVLVMRGFFRTVPVAIIEAARIDGCSWFKHFLPHCFAIGAAGGCFPLHPRRCRYLERVYLGPDLFALGRVTDSATWARSVQHPVFHPVRPTCRRGPDFCGADRVSVPVLPTLFRRRNGRGGEIMQKLTSDNCKHYGLHSLSQNPRIEFESFSTPTPKTRPTINTRLFTRF